MSWLKNNTTKGDGGKKSTNSTKSDYDQSKKQDNQKPSKDSRWT